MIMEAMNNKYVNTVIADCMFVFVEECDVQQVVCVPIYRVAI